VYIVIPLFAPEISNWLKILSRRP